MEALLYSQCTVHTDRVLVWTKWWFGHLVTKTQWNSHAQSYMHPGVLGTIQIRAGSWVYRTGCERGRAVRGRSVLWILMSGRVVGMERNNRAPLCSTLHPSYSQRGKEAFSQSLSPLPLHFQRQALPPHPPHHQPAWQSSCGATDYFWFHASLSPGAALWSTLSRLNEGALRSLLMQNV